MLVFEPACHSPRAHLAETQPPRKVEGGLWGCFGNVGFENGILVLLNSHVKKALRGIAGICKGLAASTASSVARSTSLHPACLDKGILQVMLTGVTHNLHGGHQPPWAGVLCCSVSDIKVRVAQNGHCFLRQGSLHR